MNPEYPPSDRHDTEDFFIDFCGPEPVPRLPPVADDDAHVRSMLTAIHERIHDALSSEISLIHLRSELLSEATAALVVEGAELTFLLPEVEQRMLGTLRAILQREDLEIFTLWQAAHLLWHLGPQGRHTLQNLGYTAQNFGPNGDGIDQLWQRFGFRGRPYF